MDSKIVTELIQGDCNTENLLAEVEYIENNKVKISNDYAALREKLGSSGAIARIAQSIVDFMH